MKKFRVGIDASRSTSGGAIEHLAGIVNGLIPENYNIEFIHLWAPVSTLDLIGNYPWLVKHTTPSRSYFLPVKLFWQKYILCRLGARLGIDLFINTDAGTLLKYKHSITICQDLLPFEITRGKNKKSFSPRGFRILILSILAKKALANCDACIFLTNYGSQLVKQQVSVKKSQVVYHGFDKESFSRIFPLDKPPLRPTLLYISNFEGYKHQLEVLEAVCQVRENLGVDFKLRFIGGGRGWYSRELRRMCAARDQRGDFVSLENFASRKFLVEAYAESSVFIFASSCEAFGITLLEAMGTGIPIACSKESSLPEILSDCGVYFDPVDVPSISAAIAEAYYESIGLRPSLAKARVARAGKFDWEIARAETWGVVNDVLTN